MKAPIATTLLLAAVLAGFGIAGAATSSAAPVPAFSSEVAVFASYDDDWDDWYDDDWDDRHDDDWDHD